jgi:hypothetical protein
MPKVIVLASSKYYNYELSIFSLSTKRTVSPRCHRPQSTKHFHFSYTVSKYSTCQNSKPWSRKLSPALGTLVSTPKITRKSNTISHSSIAFSMLKIPILRIDKKWKRRLAVTDQNIYNVYEEQMERYFGHCELELKVHKTKIGEKDKTIPTFLSIVDSMDEVGIYRKMRRETFESAFGTEADCGSRNQFWLLAEDL